MEDDYDCVVIGAGIEGSWAAYHLSKRNQRTLILEQFDIPHSRGSSQGGSRIIRKGYKNTFEADLMNDAYREWNQLERDADVELFVPTELLFLGKAGTRHSQTVENVISGFRRNPGSRYTVLSADELHARFPAARFGSEYYGCLDHEAGILKASKCLTAVQIASHDGVNIDPDERDMGDNSHILQYVKGYIKEHFPGVDTTPAIIETCMYAETPDHICILDRHPKHKNILFACGFSVGRCSSGKL